MYLGYVRMFKESTQEKQEENALTKSKKRGKKGKNLKNWQGDSDTIWQGRRRYK